MSEALADDAARLLHDEGLGRPQITRFEYP
jgi:hypothetical protein